MGRLLTLFSGLIVAILLGLLAAPYLVDWGRYRTTIQSEISKAIDLPISIDGAIDIVFLPVPNVTLSDVKLGPQGAEARIATLRIELAAAALLKGEWRASEIKLFSPTLWMSLHRGGRL